MENHFQQDMLYRLQICAMMSYVSELELWARADNSLTDASTAKIELGSRQAKLQFLVYNAYHVYRVYQNRRKSCGIHDIHGIHGIQEFRLYLYTFVYLLTQCTFTIANF